MSKLTKLFKAAIGGGENGAATQATPTNLASVKAFSAIPTVKFDSTRVTEKIKDDIRECIRSTPEIDEGHFEQIYNAALSSILRGGDLALLFSSIIDAKLNSISKQRAQEITRIVHNRATALMTAERQEALGIEFAIWKYSGAPCVPDPKRPSSASLRQDATHKAADGKRYAIKKGMFLNRKWTIPGYENGCRCSSKSVIPGLEVSEAK